MGFFSFLLGGSKNREQEVNEGTQEAAESTVSPMGNYAMNRQLGQTSASGTTSEPSLSASSENAVEGEMAAGKDSVLSLYDELRTTKRGGIHFSSGNSRQYDKLMFLLDMIDHKMGIDFKDNMEENLRSIREMEELYERLIDACTVYAARNPKTAAGKERKQLVLKIQQMAARDLVGISAAHTDFCSMPLKEQSKQKWGEIINRARSVRLRVKNLNALGKASGGQASEVLKLQEENLDKEGGSESLSGLHFFKPEDEIDINQEKPRAMVLGSVLKRFPKVTGEEREALWSWAQNDSSEEPPVHTEDGKSALEMVKIRAVQAKTIKTGLITPGQLKGKDGKINMTRRNVATSRMAALLGLEHLVAKSETAEIYDEATEQTISGNLMEKAEGISGNELIGKVRKDKSTLIGTDGNVQRDMMNLQVFDALCGQVDRHLGNIMMTLDGSTEGSFTGKEKITGIKGIDNDGAFGTLGDSSHEVNKYHRMVYNDETGQLTLPYMDKKLAQRIKELKPEAVRYALKGLITEEEIEAAVNRLTSMQKAIENTKDESRFLEDDQWNEETGEKLFNMEEDAFEETQVEYYRIEKIRKEYRSRLEEYRKIPEEEQTEEQKAEYQALQREAKEVAEALKVQRWRTLLSKSNYYGSLIRQQTGATFSNNIFYRDAQYDGMDASAVWKRHL